jgi:hypothetical protein
MVDTKLTGLAAITSVDGDDLLYVASDPTGTATSKKIRVDNFLGFCGAYYTSDAGQSISGSVYSIVDFEDKTYDTDNAVTTGVDWKFTCPANKGGYYLVTAFITFVNSSTWDVAEELRLLLYKNGTIYSSLFEVYSQTAAVNTRRSAIGSDVIKLNPGEYINVVIFQNSGDTLALVSGSSINHVSINRLLGI